MLTGTHEYEKGRASVVKKYDSIDEEYLDPCGDARKMMNTLKITTREHAMKAIQEEQVRQKLIQDKKPER